MGKGQRCIHLRCTYHFGDGSGSFTLELGSLYVLKNRFKTVFGVIFFVDCVLSSWNNKFFIWDCRESLRRSCLFVWLLTKRECAYWNLFRVILWNKDLFTSRMDMSSWRSELLWAEIFSEISGNSGKQWENQWGVKNM